MIWTVLVPVVLVCTVPKSKGDGLSVNTGAAEVLDGLKAAFSATDPFITTVQLPVPLHAPDQPLNKYPFAGLALSVTLVP